jgi:hypothetical protein
MDIHGASKNWIIANGARYGWKLNDYPGSHGGHFDFNGAGSTDLASTSNAPTAGGASPTAASPAAATVDAPMTNSFGINLADFKSASANTGTEMMATSAQVASSNRGGGGSPTIVNNYYGPGGGQQSGTGSPSSVTTGIDMNAAGLGAFQDLQIRTLT